MNSEQIKDMHLLYNAVYDEELREQFEEYNNTIYDEDIVEVATEYFYSYGLNEDGIGILIEKVGLESFVEYVYDLSEDLILTEARKVSKAKKQPGSLRSRQQEKLAAQRAASEKKETEREEPESRGVESQAKAEQPKSKKPEKGGIARAISGALRRAGEDIVITAKVAREVGKRAENSAPVKKFWGMKEEVEAWVNQLVEEGYDLSEYTWDEMVEIYESSVDVREDLYDIILSHIINEGYAETVEEAEVIMVNMSEEWRESIVEAVKDQSDKQIDKGVKTTYKAKGILANQASRGLNRLPSNEREGKKERMNKRLETRRDDLFGERNKREDESRAEMKKKYGL